MDVSQGPTALLERRSASRPVLITGASRSRVEEARERQRRYLFGMSLRGVCFLTAVAVPLPLVRLLAVIAAIVLPYACVVSANTVRRLGPGRRPAFVTIGAPPSLPAGAKPSRRGTASPG